MLSSDDLGVSFPVFLRKPWYFSLCCFLRKQQIGLKIRVFFNQIHITFFLILSVMVLSSVHAENGDGQEAVPAAEATSDSDSCVLVVPKDAECKCVMENDTITQMKNMVCPFSEMREAMAHKQMAQVIAGHDVFQTLHSNDVIRMQRGTGGKVIFNPLKDKIVDTHKTFRKLSHYTLNVATYPIEATPGTCAEHSTITQVESNNNTEGQAEGQAQRNVFNISDGSSTLSVDKEIDPIFTSYIPIEDKKPFYFEVRQDADEKMILCENDTVASRQRALDYCGDNKKCSENRPPPCSSFSTDEPQKNTCISLDEFEDLLKKFLWDSHRHGIICPTTCSYYTQTLQKVQRKGRRNICAENYLIIHCGPKKTSETYNLNIKVVDDFCDNYNVTCLSPAN